MEASVDPQCGGPDWTPITPKTGSLFHAETHSDLRVRGLCNKSGPVFSSCLCRSIPRSRNRVPTRVRHLWEFFRTALWSQPESHQLPGPLRRCIAQRCDADSAWEATFDCGFNERWREECERDGHIDLPDAAPLLSGESLDGLLADNNLLKPKTAAADRPNESGPALGLHGPSPMLGRVGWKQDFPGRL